MSPLPEAALLFRRRSRRRDVEQVAAFRDFQRNNTLSRVLSPPKDDGVVPLQSKSSPPLLRLLDVELPLQHEQESDLLPDTLKDGGGQR